VSLFSWGAQSRLLRNESSSRDEGKEKGKKEKIKDRGSRNESVVPNR
jgi:hypothetical protein